MSIVFSASVQLECGLKAYCVGDRILCDSMCVISCLFISVSSSLARIGRREIGRKLAGFFFCFSYIML